MGTKWKNRIIMGTWAFMFTIGLSGLLSFFSFGNSYTQQDYFHTPEFRFELDQFAAYLSMFELNSINLEEAKKSITVTEADITEYRDRSGYLNDQINHLRNEYEAVIQDALVSGNQEAADVYLAERDKQIEDITSVFTSDEYVAAKVIHEKEQTMNDYYRERENYRSNYLKYKEAFQYYFKDSVTGKVYTNLSNVDNESATNNMFPSNMLFFTSYSIPKEFPMYYGIPGYEEFADSFISFEGQIAITKSLASSNPFMIDFELYKQKKVISFVYTLASIVALILCFFLFNKAKAIPAGFEKWMPYYNKLPLDLRAVFIIISGFSAVIFLSSINELIFADIVNPFVYGRDILISIVMASVIWCLTLIQGRFLASQLMDWQNIKKEWNNALLNKAIQSMKSNFNKTKHSLKDAFSNKSTGMQLLMILFAVFSLGLAAIMMIVHPFFILVYLILLAFIGLPIVLILINRIGYFNRIVLTTNELAVGNLGQDLPVSGKSVLAMLAENINVLKQGVKTSQNEQAKSERLKTELITNVSHDLRTPLTSIITYTELLKTGDVSSEDRTAYLEIIDKKSKRLKVIIDDLFEVSKMVSGNIELTTERVDLVQLLQQALAEYDNTINESSLQFRITYSKMPIYALVDGKKLWRVFDNLIGNILKYSLENSRVYITVGTFDDQAILTFKNVSKYELSENMDELFERFKRGDTSRQTEGSGLGLAIAKSIVDLHEGRLDIEADGDLFKVCISLKLDL